MHSGIVTLSVLIETIALLGIIFTVYLIFRVYDASDKLKPAMMNIGIGIFLGSILAALYFFLPIFYSDDSAVIVEIVLPMMLLAISAFISQGFYKMLRVYSKKSPKNTQIAWEKFPVRGISYITLIAGALVMVGWIFNISVLRSLLPGFPTMKMITALGFIVLGTMLFFLSKKAYSAKINSRLALTLIIISFAVGLVITASAPENSETVVVPPILDPLSEFPNFATIICFILVGFATLRLSNYSKNNKNIVTLIGAVVITLAFIAIGGYIFNQPTLYYYWPELVGGMALHTAMLFILNGLAIIAISRINYAA